MSQRKSTAYPPEYLSGKRRYIIGFLAALLAIGALASVAGYAGIFSDSLGLR